MSSTFAKRLAPRNLEATTFALLGGLLTLSTILVLLTARDGLQNLFERWTQEEEYGYGFVIVGLVPLFIWNNWHLVAGRGEGSRLPGFFILLLGQILAVLSVLGESFFLEQVALIVSLLGIALSAFGIRSHRLFLPLAVLLFLTIPLPYTLQAMLTIKLQLLSTNIGVAIIQLLGIPVFVDGNIIDLGVYKLQVAEACSGLRYLLPLIGISYLVAYLYKAAFWKKVIVVASAAPITIAINSFRIAMTAALVNRFGIEMAEGFLHQFEGWIVFLLGILLLACIIVALEGFSIAKVELQPLFRRSRLASKGFPGFTAMVPVLIAFCVCLATFAASTSIADAARSLPPPTRKSFIDFPTQLGGWTVDAKSIQSQQIVNELKSTDGYFADFTARATAPTVNLFVAYYDSLSKNAAIHSPRVCLPGSGWEFSSFQERKFNELIPGVSGTYNDVVIQKGTQKILMFYWYQQRQRHTADEFAMKYYLLVDSLLQSRKDGALVRIFTPIVTADGDKAETNAAARLLSFVRAAYPALPAYLPNS
jgi:exosortase D (VPLPA-CTERM-specific)